MHVLGVTFPQVPEASREARPAGVFTACFVFKYFVELNPVQLSLGVLPYAAHPHIPDLLPIRHKFPFNVRIGSTPSCHYVRKLLKPLKPDTKLYQA